MSIETALDLLEMALFDAMAAGDNVEAARLQVEIDILETRMREEKGNGQCGKT